MIGFTIRRILAIIPVLLVVATVTFAMMKATKGGPFDGNEKMSDITRRSLEAKFGLNKPVWFNTAAFSDTRAETGNRGYPGHSRT